MPTSAANPKRTAAARQPTDFRVSGMTFSPPLCDRHSTQIEGGRLSDDLSENRHQVFTGKLAKTHSTSRCSSKTAKTGESARLGIRTQPTGPLREFPYRSLGMGYVRITRHPKSHEAAETPACHHKILQPREAGASVHDDQIRNAFEPTAWLPRPRRCRIAS